MSEQESVGDVWGDDISEERKAELEQQLQAWAQEADHGKKGPFDGVVLTGADVFWLAARALASTGVPHAVAEQKGLLLKARTSLDMGGSLRLDSLHLEGANLRHAHLERAHIFGIHLEGAHLDGAHMEWANLTEARLEEADLAYAHLKRASLWSAYLEGARLPEADLEGANLNGANLERANLILARLSGAYLVEAKLAEASLDDADLEGANLNGANLEGAALTRAVLVGANLSVAHLERADLRLARLDGADLSQATFDSRTDLRDAVLTGTPHWYSAFLGRLRRERVYGPVSLADIHWNDVDVTVADWSSVRRLGDERSEWRWQRRRRESERATRANTQLAARLRDAGMNDDADRFAYRAQVCQRGVHLVRARFGRWLFSWLLFIVAGYGYRPLRTLFWYLAVIFGFALLYMNFGHVGGHPFEFDEALVFSVTSFHGRGFFPGTLDLKDVVTKLAASEAVFGLFIEVSFIATFTQRYFGK